MKKILITILCCLIMLPAFAGVKKTMSRCMDSWMGFSIDAVINKWGYPTRKDEFAGRQVYFWEHNQYFVYGNQTGVFGVPSACTRILEVNDKNEVVRWEWKGNDCPATYCTVKKWVNPLNDPWILEKEAKQKL